MFSKEYQNISLEGDSISLLNVAIKRELSWIYKLLKDYQQAWNFEHQASVMMDSLYEKANYNKAIEMSTIFESETQELKIIEQQYSISICSKFCYIKFNNYEKKYF